jgi:signal transduction histidine kinase
MRDARIARLREPLGIILGWVELLRRGRLDEAKARSALDAIARNARLQADLLDEILATSKKGHPTPLLLKKASKRVQASSASALRKVGR